MKIYRILNTNAVLSKDLRNREIVLIGSGLGYKAKIGDTINNERIEKQFRIYDLKTADRLEEMFSSIPQRDIMLSEQIISYAQKIYNLKLNDSIHISLAEHINLSIDNAKDSIFIPNTLLDEIRQFYPDEYEIGKAGLQYIKEATGYQLKDDEAGFIAMHFVNVESKGNKTNAKKIINLVNELNEMIKFDLSTDFDLNSNTYHRYITHLKFFASRIVNRDETGQNTNDDNFVLIAERFAKEYECSKKIAKYVTEKYGYSVNQDEIVYLTIHLANISK